MIEKQIQDKLSGKSLFLYLIFFCLLGYVFNDLQASTNIGVRDANRNVVYLILATIIGLFAAYVFLSEAIFFDSISTALFILSFSVIFTNLIQNSNPWMWMVHLGLSVWWFFTYLFYSTYLIDNPKGIRVLKISLFILLIIYVFASMYSAFNIINLYDRDFAVLNLSYYVLVFFPLILNIENKAFRYLGIILISLVVLFSFKRGAIIAYLAMSVVYSYIEMLISKKEKCYIFNFKIIGLVISFIIMFFIVDHISGGFLKNRFMLDELLEGSGRRSNFIAAWDNIINRNFTDLMFGLGSGSSVERIGTGVHNEWLEFLFSFGLFGLFSYFLLFIALINKFILLLKIKSKYSSSFGTMLVYFFFVGMYGGIYFVHSTFYVVLFWGLTVAHLKSNLREY
jgi:hypothetical protein